MAKIYFEKLNNLINQLNLDSDILKTIEVKHFFSGAALYINNKICVSWSPSGLAFKLPQQEVNNLINKEKAIPLKYFPKGHIKKYYAVFEQPEKRTADYWQPYFIKAFKEI